MGKLYMQDECIFNYRQLHRYFSPREMLLEKQDFAVLANNLFGHEKDPEESLLSANDTPAFPVGKRKEISLRRHERSFLCSLFMLSVLRCKGRLAQMDPCSLCGYDMLPMEDRKERIRSYIQHFETYIVEDPIRSLRMWTERLMGGMGGVAPRLYPHSSSQYSLYVSERVQLAEGLYAIVEKTDLSPRQKTELFFMLHAGYLLSGHTLKSTPLHPQEAQQGFLEERPGLHLEQELTGVISPLRDFKRQEAVREADQTSAAANGSAKRNADANAPKDETESNYFSDETILLLPVREKPHRFNLHPACSQSGIAADGLKNIRQLPEGCVIRNHIIKAAPHPSGIRGMTLTLQFFPDEKSQTPVQECRLREGEYLHLNAVHDGKYGMALEPLADEVVNGMGRMTRDVTRAGELTLNGQTLENLARNGECICAFAPSPRGGGCLYIRGGSLCNWKFEVDSLQRMIRLLQEDGVEPLVDMRLKGATLYVLTCRGAVLKGDGSEIVRMGNWGRVLTLKDIGEQEECEHEKDR